MAKIKVIDIDTVDGEPWYTIICDLQVMRWLRERDPGSYRYLDDVRIGHLFEIPESTYIMMKIVWSN